MGLRPLILLYNVRFSCSCMLVIGSFLNSPHLQFLWCLSCFAFDVGFNLVAWLQTVVWRVRVEPQIVRRDSRDPNFAHDALAATELWFIRGCGSASGSPAG